jgi:hypothetical protein
MRQKCQQLHHDIQQACMVNVSTSGTTFLFTKNSQYHRWNKNEVDTSEEIKYKGI